MAAQPQLFQQHVRIAHDVVVEPIPRLALGQVPSPAPSDRVGHVLLPLPRLVREIVSTREFPVKIGDSPQRLDFSQAEIVPDGEFAEEDERVVRRV